MDLREYFRDMRKTESELMRKYPNGVVFVTSVFHRERNSTAGCTLSATWENAARVITDGTHKESTPEEIQGFLNLQKRNHEQAVLAEQGAKKQYFVMVKDQEPSGEDADALVHAGGESPAQGKRATK